MFFVKNATEDDIERILVIEQEAISPPWSHGTLLSEIYNEDSFFSIVKYKTFDHPFGFVILRRMGDEGELLQIAVDKAFRKQGIADMLMIAALQFAEESGLASVFLEVRKSNSAAIALYEKHGFNSVRIRKDYYNEPVEDAVVMVLEI